MKKIRFMCLLTAIFVMFLPAVSAYAEETNYTYNYDFWYEQVASPDAYYVGDYLTGVDFGLSNFKEPQGLFIRDNHIFVCDTGNNRIVWIDFNEKDGTYALNKVVESVMINGEESKFSAPSDLFETKEGEIYICDQKNERILHLDADWNFIQAIGRPDDLSFSSDAQFLPSKLIVDSAQRIYVQATNVNKGLMEYDNQGNFTGYMGANEVTINMADYIWKTVFSTKAQQAQMELFVPTEYNNLCLDYDGFIYTTTSTFDENAIMDADPVRRLNAMGKDILVRNGYENPIGDLATGTAGGIGGCSRFVDVVALENDSYCCLDKTRGRLFMYDFQGNLLYAFGGNGNKKGYFQYPTAIDEMGYSLFVLDLKSASVTRFDLTEYGSCINEGLRQYKKGHYDESAVYWEKVLKMNGNYDLAYIGIGRAALRQGDYKKAMHYFKVKNDSVNYGKAFQLYRKQWMEQNIGKIIAIIVILILLPKVIRMIRKFYKEVTEE